MRIRGLRFSYGPHCVFESLDWESDARIIAFRGPSGCGKSTLLRLLGGDLRPDLATEFPAIRRSFLVLQEDALFPWLTGLENLRTLLRWQASAVEGHPLFCAIAEFADTPACRLSYGQRRAIELCRAMMWHPDHLLLDEPFNFLDPLRRSFFAEKLRSLSQDGTRVLLTTHYAQDADGLAEETYVFSGALPVHVLARL